MKTKEHLIDKILDQYLDGVITEEQVKELHERLERDEMDFIEDIDLEQVEIPKEITEAPPVSQLYKQAKLRQKKASAANHNRPQHLPPPEQVATIARKYMLGAIVFFVILLTVPFMMLLMPLQNMHSIFKEYFKPLNVDNAEILPVDLDGKVRSEWRDALSSYKEKKYPSARMQLQAFKSKYQELDLQSDLLIGISLMALEKHPEAINKLQPLVEKESLVKDEAQWYLALAQLKMGELRESNILLQAIPNDSEFRHRANELVQDIQGM